MLVTNETTHNEDPLKTVRDYTYQIKMTKDELYNLRVLVNSMDNPTVNDVATLIHYILNYYAEHAFMSVREPGNNG